MPFFLLGKNDGEGMNVGGGEAWKMALLNKISGGNLMKTRN